MSGIASSPLSAEAILAQMERIVASEIFLRSNNSTKLLRFLVKEDLEGRGQELKDSVIALEVFGKKDYDSKVDRTVAQEAGRLRARLAEYYKVERIEDSIRVSIPLGGYKPKYELIVPAPVPPTPPKAPWWTPTRVWLAAGGLAIVAMGIGAWLIFSRTPAEKHVAVLPFRTIDSSPESQARRLGLLFSLVQQLNQRGRAEAGFWTVPPDDVLAANVVNSSRACQVFGANRVISGSIETVAGKTRLTMSAGYCNPSHEAKSAIIDFQAGDPLALEDQAAERAAEMLGIQPRTGGQPAAAEVRTLQPQAEDFYLRARGYLLEGAAGLDNAIGLFREAVESDPNYALAHAGLGEAYLRKYERLPAVALIDLARESCKQALRLGSGSAQVHIAQGLFYNTTGEYEKALHEYEEALRLDPGNADAYGGLALVYANLDGLKEAEEAYNQAIRQRHYWGAYHRLGVFYATHGRYAEAEQAFLSAQKLAPDNAVVYSNCSP
ncbi:MAG: hypothetical protein C5B51_15170 [Terriglobia bacterium]|nr:MAG: hypothetical protein C5B51_15170 [Terriglobia bacterium]